MNKEFKKLLEASYTKGFEECARTGHKVGDLDAIFNSIVMGEFAELIVRECLNEIESQRSNGENDDQWTITRDLCYHNMMAQLKQHFGVEE